VLLTKVLYRKTGGKKKFVIVDAAMNDLIRPAFYGSFHFIWPARYAEAFTRDKDFHLAEGETVGVVGPICESGDFLARDRVLPPTERGDLLAIYTAGAYAFAMSSNYNNRPRAAEVLVDATEARLIRRRETYEDLVAAELAV
jgi:diaminopimelate decarboxylase